MPAQETGERRKDAAGQKREGSMQASSSKRESAAKAGSSSSRPKPPTKLANGRFQIEKRLGAGCFGEVYRAKRCDTGKEGHENEEESSEISYVAVKFEDLQARTQQLEQEAAIMSLLRQPVQPQGFSRCFLFGKEHGFAFLVMEYLGKSLEEIMQQCGSRLTPLSTALIASQLINRLEMLHSKGIVHRDIKPENFVFGRDDKIGHVYLIDFGLSKKYWDKVHLPLRDKLSLTGTARYASINAHKGIEQSRRDDLEAVGHMLLYFLRGVLPWSGLDARTKEEKYRKIREKKEETRLDILCEGYPEQYRKYLEYCRGLEFQQRPDYNLMRQWFKEVRDSVDPKVADFGFEWFQNVDCKSFVPLLQNESPAQPDDVAKPAGSFRRAFCFCGGKQPRAD